MDLNFASFKEIVKSLTIEMVEKAVKKSKKEAKQSKQDSITDRMFPDRHNQVTQHSITVRMGTVFEKAFNKFAKISGALPLYDGEDIEKHQMLFNHETDTLFRFPQDTIYCFENKTGAGVDTEKTQKTKLKVTEWETELTKNNNARVICKVLTAGSPTGDSVKNLRNLY